MLVGLLADDGFYASGLEQRDDAVFAIPNAVASSPDFVGVDLAAGGQHDGWLTAASGADAWAAGGDGIAAGRGV